METKSYSVTVGDKTLVAEFNDLANQANGSVIVRSENTVVLATAVMGEKENKDAGYFPLKVDYEERFYAAGQILGSRFMRREGKPSDEAVLGGRVVDRTLRPLFDQRITNDVHVVITILSLGEQDPVTLAVNAASLALLTSDIPWNGPVGAIRIGRKGGEKDFIVNPPLIYQEGKNFDIDLLACGKDQKINMIEVGAHEAKEEDLVEALVFSSKQIEVLEEWQKSIKKEIGKEKKVLDLPVIGEEATTLFETSFAKDLKAKVFTKTPGKKSIGAAKKEWLELAFKELPEESPSLLDSFFEEKISDIIHVEGIENNERVDGRNLDEVRPLFAKAGGVSELLHGSGVFYRGGTHILSVLTLGGPEDSLLIDGMEEQRQKTFLHHYNFPPFSVGEAGRIGGFNRRMIGHGALAEKAIEPVMPNKEVFPYTVRVVSEALASNGSTSMGSVCASTLALMDAGVPITRPVAGIASGILINKKGEYKILTDIQGPEDHHGDMDFKVAGTREGVTAVQMDVKVEGISLAALKDAFDHAKDARFQILDVIEKEIQEPRSDISTHAPKVLVIKIKPSQIGGVIGSGGKTIKEIKEFSGAEISVEDDGMVFVTGKDGAAEKAKKLIEEMTREYGVGERFSGTVTRVTDFGAFVEVGYQTEGLVHVSEIAPFRIERVSDVLKEGEKVNVIVKEIDERGRINLSIKDVDEEFAQRKGIKPSVNNQNNSGPKPRGEKPKRDHR